MPIELSPQCPKAETLYSQIRRTINSHVGVWRYQPSRITLETKATGEGFVLYVYATLNGETIPTYVRRHHEMKPVPMNEADMRQRVEFVIPRLVKVYRCRVEHFHASIIDVQPEEEGPDFPF
jgi:hypothetical protein